ncbi:hypothetical protein MGG_00812 [Pyricularia oryzae 70-15]|uniref:FMC1 protein family n=3 Tax=Pyricularia oryzae TaxID=318829 RepID=G4NEA5_PYRO7|nr:uncharacterized protein MGG_00812 [Pyricularia oryzae 70-15]EHA48588.1 hypothetical protein MGG_00812 [Pyricularia oryzae 70-15]ELQ32963.1 hypothetical protein OOU_Y34scaffold01007g12 [Pyricularia oryzae Y34]KAI7920148.1 hypothetical protein M9X92_005993 [Pyricularia oryzae]KAI7924501.1 hypothetical protein M0657_004545 [Pyricularia oryzae]
MASTTIQPTNPTAIRSLYRSLLRALPARQHILSSDPTPLHRTLRAQFRQPSPGAEPPSPRAIEQARQYAAYFSAQRTYTALLERYNPGMGMDEEERVRLTARRVGMDLPVEFDGSEK